jgi:hypothetical protein
VNGNNIVFLQDLILATVTAIIRVLRLRQRAIKGGGFKGIYTRCCNGFFVRIVLKEVFCLT